MICKYYKELVGKQLLHDILDVRGVMLIPVDTVLTAAHTKKLEQFKISIFEIHVEAVIETVEREEAQPVLLQTEASAWVKQTEGKLKEIEDFTHKTGKVPAADFEENVLPVIMEATQQRNIYKLFAELKAEGDYRYNHSIGVAVIATTIGRWLQMDEKEMNLLTTAASLCDIGTVKLPSELVQKTSGLQPHEYEILKQHTKIGHDLLLESGLDRRVALVALQHHEKNDGSGYPAKLRGSEIDPLSKIVALADMYIAMTSERPHRPALPFYQVINTLYEEILHNRLDSHMGLIFLNKLMTAQIGSDIFLDDGRRGRIVLTNANYPTCPLISIGNEFLDLSKTPDLKIREIVG
jgi:HD-GYP domain-containing protein (c-di-GMP phosphodiesterase class II)